MRCAEFLSRVAAVGFILAQIGSLPALADTSHDTPDLRQRVFFSRGRRALAGRGRCDRRP